MNTALIRSIVALACCIAGTAALAQPDPDRATERLSERLALDEAQTSAVAEMLTEHHAEMAASRERMHERIRALLTSEQAERFDAMRSRMSTREGRGDRHRQHDRMHGRMGERRDRANKPRWADLELSDEQRSQLEAEHQRHREQMQHLRESHQQAMREILGDDYERLHQRKGSDRPRRGQRD